MCQHESACPASTLATVHGTDVWQMSPYSIRQRKTLVPGIMFLFLSLIILLLEGNRDQCLSDQRASLGSAPYEVTSLVCPPTGPVLATGIPCSLVANYPLVSKSELLGYYTGEFRVASGRTNRKYDIVTEIGFSAKFDTKNYRHAEEFHRPC